MPVVKRPAAGEVDPMQHIGETLWVVYGFECFPSILCCRLKQNLIDVDRTIETCIWGYSVYRREPGFRTLGKTLQQWRNDHAKYGQDLEVWFTEQEAAMAYLNLLVTPAINPPRWN